jgi:hypothetical protein
MTTAIWNHDLTSDRTVITSGGNVTVIGPGAMQEFEGKLGEEVLAEAKRSGVPFSTTPADGVVVGGQVFKREEGRGKREEAPKLIVPVGIFDRANLMRLDRDLLLRMAACLGAVLEEEATKKACVEIILQAGDGALSQRALPTAESISGSAHVPPTVTGENQPAQTEEEK